MQQEFQAWDWDWGIRFKGRNLWVQSEWIPYLKILNKTIIFELSGTCSGCKSITPVQSLIPMGHWTCMLNSRVAKGKKWREKAWENENGLKLISRCWLHEDQEKRNQSLMLEGYWSWLHAREKEEDLRKEWVLVLSGCLSVSGKWSKVWCVLILILKHNIPLVNFLIGPFT
jgi:hypothetical protein